VCVCVPVTVDGRVFVVGGAVGSAQNVVEAYDTREGRWATLPHMLARREGAAVGAAGQFIYAAGGFSGLSLESVEVFDIRASKWRRLPDMKKPAGYVASGTYCRVGGCGCGWASGSVF
jgi:hypothetical protein